MLILCVYLMKKGEKKEENTNPNLSWRGHPHLHPSTAGVMLPADSTK